MGHVRLRASDDLPAVQERVEQVAARIRQIMEELQQTRQQAMLSDRLAAVGELAAGVAHEIRNPLCAVKLLVQTLAQRQAGGGGISPSGSGGWPVLQARRTVDRFPTCCAKQVGNLVLRQATQRVPRLPRNPEPRPAVPGHPPGNRPDGEHDPRNCSICPAAPIAPGQSRPAGNGAAVVVSGRGAGQAATSRNRAGLPWFARRDCRRSRTTAPGFRQPLPQRRRGHAARRHAWGRHFCRAGKRDVPNRLYRLGPGIPELVLEKIFEPFVTNKECGSAWGWPSAGGSSKSTPARFRPPIARKAVPCLPSNYPCEPMTQSTHSRLSLRESCVLLSRSERATMCDGWLNAAKPHAGGFAVSHQPPVVKIHQARGRRNA